MHMVLQWLSRGELSRLEGATIPGGDGALNRALYPPDANPPSGRTYAHCSSCSDEKSAKC